MVFLAVSDAADSSCTWDAVEIMAFRSSYLNHSSFWFPAFFSGSLPLLSMSSLNACDLVMSSLGGEVLIPDVERGIQTEPE